MPGNASFVMTESAKQIDADNVIIVTYGLMKESTLFYDWGYFSTRSGRH